MSKKIISAILAIAMIVSMSATMFVTSVGAAAATGYAADRDALGEAIRNLYITGPSLSAETVAYLKAVGLVNKDETKDQVKARKDLWGDKIDNVNQYFFTGDIEAKAAALSEKVQYAASVWYFGQDAEDEAFEAEFNAARNTVVKDAIKLLADEVKALKAEVGEGSNKPALYKAAYEAYLNFAEDNKNGFIDLIGVNPYAEAVANNDFWAKYAVLLNKDSFLARWYTWDEIKVICPAEYDAFQKELRKLAVNKAEGVLYTDFAKDSVKALDDAYAAICKALRAGNDAEVNVGKLDFTAEYKSLVNLEAALKVFGAYSQILYTNIYSVQNLEFLTNVLYAQQIVTYLKEENTNGIYALKILDLDKLTADIIAGLEKATVSAELQLDDADIVAAVSAINYAEYLLDAWADFVNKGDDYKKVYNDLKNATADLKNMIPLAAGASVDLDIAEKYVEEEFVEGTEKVKVGSDAFSVTFVPNKLSYKVYTAKLEAAVKAVMEKVNPKAEIKDEDLRKSAEDALKAVLNKYGFLAGLVGKVGEFDNVARAIYAADIFDAADINNLGTVADITSIYEKVVGKARNGFKDDVKDSDIEYDIALENVIAFVNQYNKSLNFYNGVDGYKDAYTDDYKYNWSADGSTSTFTSKYQKAADAVTALLKYLTRDLTVEASTYKFILDNIAEYFDLVQYDKAKYVYAPGAVKFDDVTSVFAYNKMNAFIDEALEKIKAVSTANGVVTVEDIKKAEKAIVGTFNTSNKKFEGGLVESYGFNDLVITFAKLQDAVNQILDAVDNVADKTKLEAQINKTIEIVKVLTSDDELVFNFNIGDIMGTYITLGFEAFYNELDGVEAVPAEDWNNFIKGYEDLNDGFASFRKLCFIVLQILQSTDVISVSWETDKLGITGFNGFFVTNVSNKISDLSGDNKYQLFTYDDVTDEYAATLSELWLAKLEEIVKPALEGTNEEFTAALLKFVAEAIDPLFNTKTGLAVTDPAASKLLAKIGYSAVTNGIEGVFSGDSSEFRSKLYKDIEDFIKDLKDPLIVKKIYDEDHRIYTAKNPLDSVPTNMWIVREATEEDPKADYQKEDNYPKGLFDNFVDAANKLEVLLDRTTLKVEKEGVKVGTNGDIIPSAETKSLYEQANLASLKAAYEKFIEAVKALLTDNGDAALDSFIADVYKYAAANIGEDASFNNYEKLYAKLDAVNNFEVEYYFPLKPEMYFWYAYRFSTVLANGDRGNLYSNVTGSVEKNYKDKLAVLVATLDVTPYTREWAEQYKEIRVQAQYIADLFANDAELKGTDLPLWYALKVLESVQAVYDLKDENKVETVKAYKAETLSVTIAEAEAIESYAYDKNNEEQLAVWNAFVEAYANALIIENDDRCSIADVDAADEALKLAMEALEAIEKPEGAATVADLEAKIAAAEALVARADKTTDPSKAALEKAIVAAKKFLQYKNGVTSNVDLDAEIKTLDDAYKALKNAMYNAAKLKKAVKVEEMKVVIALYTDVSYNKFKRACDAAYELAAADEGKESEFMKAYDNVVARVAELKLAPVEEPVVEPSVEPSVEPVVEPKESEVKEQASAIYNESIAEYGKLTGYTAESMAAYKAALDTLKADIDNNADDAKLLESIIAVKLARAALIVPVPETFDD